MLWMSLTKLCRIQTAIAIAVFHPAALHRVRVPHDAHVTRGQCFCSPGPGGVVDPTIEA